MKDGFFIYPNSQVFFEASFDLHEQIFSTSRDSKILWAIIYYLFHAATINIHIVYFAKFNAYILIFQTFETHDFCQYKEALLSSNI
jgi:hypothetical protein